MVGVFFFFKEKTEYEVRGRDWRSDGGLSDFARGRLHVPTLTEAPVCTATGPAAKGEMARGAGWGTLVSAILHPTLGTLVGVAVAAVAGAVVFRAFRLSREWPQICRLSGLR